MGELLFWVITLYNRGQLLDSYFINDFYDTSMDYFNMLASIEGLDPYAQNTNYPAMCFLLWRILYHIVPYTVENQNGFFLKSFMPAQLGYILFSLLSIVIIRDLLKLNLNASAFEKSLLSLSLLLSGPFLFTLERGNIILLSFLFLLIFIQFYNADKKYIRFLSYIALAISASIKIYPALFGIMILNKKRYKEALITVILGILFFLLPFWAFGGFNSFLNMLHGISISSAIQSNRGMGYNFCFFNLIKIFFALLGIAVNHIPVFVKIIPTLFCVLIYSCNKEEWKKLYAITLLCIWIPDFSYTYTLILFLIPLISYLKEENLFSTRKHCVFSILYLIIFLPMALPIVPQLDVVNAKFPLNMPTLIINLAITFMSILLLLDGIYTNLLKFLYKLNFFHLFFDTFRYH